MEFIVSHESPKFFIMTETVTTREIVKVDKYVVGPGTQ